MDFSVDAWSAALNAARSGDRVTLTLGAGRFTADTTYAISHSRTLVVGYREHTFLYDNYGRGTPENRNSNARYVISDGDKHVVIGALGAGTRIDCYHVLTLLGSLSGPDLFSMSVDAQHDARVVSLPVACARAIQFFYACIRGLTPSTREERPFIAANELSINPAGYDFIYVDQPDAPCDHVLLWPKVPAPKNPTANRRAGRMIGAEPSIFSTLPANFDPTEMLTSALGDAIPFQAGAASGAVKLSILPPPQRMHNPSKLKALKRLKMSAVDLSPLVGEAITLAVDAPGPVHSLSSPIEWSTCTYAATAYYIMYYTQEGYLHWTCKEVELARRLIEAVVDKRERVANRAAYDMWLQVPGAKQATAEAVFAHYRVGPPYSKGVVKLPGIYVINLNATSHAVFAHPGGIELEFALPTKSWKPQPDSLRYITDHNVFQTYSQNTYPFVCYRQEHAAEQFFADFVEHKPRPGLYSYPKATHPRALPYCNITQAVAIVRTVELNPFVTRDTPATTASPAATHVPVLSMEVQPAKVAERVTHDPLAVDRPPENPLDKWSNHAVDVAGYRPCLTVGVTDRVLEWTTTFNKEAATLLEQHGRPRPTFFNAHVNIRHIANVLEYVAADLIFADCRATTAEELTYTCDSVAPIYARRIKALRPPANYRENVYRPNITDFDQAYNTKHAANLPDWCNLAEQSYVYDTAARAITGTEVMYYEAVRREVLRGVSLGATAFMINHSYPNQCGDYTTTFATPDGLRHEGKAIVHTTAEGLMINYVVPANPDKSYNTPMPPRHATRVGTYSEFGISVGFQRIAEYDVGPETRIELVKYTPQCFDADINFTHYDLDTENAQINAVVANGYDVCKLTDAAQIAIQSYTAANPNVDVLGLLARADQRTLTCCYTYVRAMNINESYTIEQNQLVIRYAQQLVAKRDGLATPAVLAQREATSRVTLAVARRLADEHARVAAQSVSDAAYVSRSFNSYGWLYWFTPLCIVTAFIVLLTDFANPLPSAVTVFVAILYLLNHLYFITNTLELPQQYDRPVARFMISQRPARIYVRGAFEVQRDMIECSYIAVMCYLEPLVHAVQFLALNYRFAVRVFRTLFGRTQPVVTTVPAAETQPSSSKTAPPAVEDALASPPAQPSQLHQSGGSQQYPPPSASETKDHTNQTSLVPPVQPAPALSRQPRSKKNRKPVCGTLAPRSLTVFAFCLLTVVAATATSTLKTWESAPGQLAIVNTTLELAATYWSSLSTRVEELVDRTTTSMLTTTGALRTRAHDCWEAASDQTKQGLEAVRHYYDQATNSTNTIIESVVSDTNAAASQVPALYRNYTSQLQIAINELRDAVDRHLEYHRAAIRSVNNFADNLEFKRYYSKFDRLCDPISPLSHEIATLAVTSPKELRHLNETERSAVATALARRVGPSYGRAIYAEARAANRTARAQAAYAAIHDSATQALPADLPAGFIKLTTSTGFSIFVYLVDHLYGCPVHPDRTLTAVAVATILEPALMVLRHLLPERTCRPPVAERAQEYVIEYDDFLSWFDFSSAWLANLYRPITSTLAGLLGFSCEDDYCRRYSYTGFAESAAAAATYTVQGAHIIASDAFGAGKWKAILPDLSVARCYAPLAWVIHFVLVITVLTGLRRWWQLPLLVVAKAGGAAYFSTTGDPYAAAFIAAASVLYVDTLAVRFAFHPAVRSVLHVLVMGAHQQAMFEAGFVPGKPLTAAQKKEITDYPLPATARVTFAIPREQLVDRLEPIAAQKPCPTGAYTKLVEQPARFSHFAESGVLDTLHCIIKRQLGATNRPDRTVVDELAASVRDDLPVLQQAVGLIVYKTQAEYLKTLTGRSKRQVHNGFVRLQNGARINTQLGFFAKHGEKVYSGDVLPDGQRESKPRCIATFKDTFKAIRMHVQHHINLCLEHLPHYNQRSVSGLTGDQLCERLTAQWRSFRRPVWFWFDHKVFDATQHTDLRRASDVQVQDAIFRPIAARLGYSHEQISVVEQFYRRDRLDFSYSARISGVKNPALGLPVVRGSIAGTQASGCATTSSGNGYRHVKYHDVIHRYTNIRAVENVGGDDLCGIAEYDDIGELEKLYAMFYSTQLNSQTGLGLTNDGFKWSETECDFLSMRVVVQGDCVVVSKFPRRFAAYGTSRIVTPTPEDEYLRDIASCVAAVLPLDPAYDFLRTAAPAQLPEYQVAAPTVVDLGLGKHSVSRALLMHGSRAGLLVAGGQDNSTEPRSTTHRTMHNAILEVVPKPPPRQDRNERPKRRKPAALAKEAHDAAVVALGSDPNPLQVLQSKDTPLLAALTHLEKLSQRTLLEQVGRKAALRLDSEFDKLTSQQRRRFLAAVIADDLPAMFGKIASAALPIVWSHVKRTPLVQRALTALKEVTGVDLNDRNPNYLGNQFTNDLTIRKELSWADYSPEFARSVAAFDGVNTQALASQLTPEFASCRLPTDIAVKSGCISKTQIFTLTTNASGAASFVLYPRAVASTTWASINSSAAYDPYSGTGGSWGIAVGPLYGLTSVTTFRVTGTSILIEPVVSALNNQGQLVAAMYSGATQAYAAPTLGITGLRDSEYYVSSSIAGCAGHRLVYIASSEGDPQFAGFGAAVPQDALQLIIVGAAASAVVLQITVTYQVEFTVQNNVLVGLAPPPPGAQTERVLHQSLAANPQLRVLGHEEAMQLYRELLAVPPHYTPVYNLLAHQTTRAMARYGERGQRNAESMSSIDMSP